MRHAAPVAGTHLVLQRHKLREGQRPEQRVHEGKPGRGTAEGAGHSGETVPAPDPAGFGSGIKTSVFRHSGSAAGEGLSPESQLKKESLGPGQLRIAGNA